MKNVGAFVNVRSGAIFFGFLISFSTQADIEQYTAEGSTRAEACKKATAIQDSLRVGGRHVTEVRCDCEQLAPVTQGMPSRWSCTGFIVHQAKN